MLYVRLIASILSSTIVFSASQTPSMKLEVREIISEFFIKVYFINRKKYQKREIELLPVMYQAIDIYLDMLKENNAVVKYISKNKDLPTSELVNRLFDLFPTIGYGDLQYIELINKTR